MTPSLGVTTRSMVRGSGGDAFETCSSKWTVDALLRDISLTEVQTCLNRRSTQPLQRTFSMIQLHAPCSQNLFGMAGLMSDGLLVSVWSLSEEGIRNARCTLPGAPVHDLYDRLDIKSPAGTSHGRRWRLPGSARRGGPIAPLHHPISALRQVLALLFPHRWMPGRQPVSFLHPSAWSEEDAESNMQQDGSQSRCRGHESGHVALIAQQASRGCTHQPESQP